MSFVRILLSVMFFPAFVLLVRGVGARSRALRGVAVLSGVGATSLVINYPSLVDRAAREFGVSTATDFVLYLMVLVMATMTGYMIGKFRRLEKRLSTVVHEIAVKSADSELKPQEKSFKDAPHHRP